MSGERGEKGTRYHLCPNFKVEIVSSMLYSWGEHAISMQVLVLPPSDSYTIHWYLAFLFGCLPSHTLSTWVSFESRYGTCLFFFKSVREWIQFPNAERDWLIFFACCNFVSWSARSVAMTQNTSSSVCPVAPVFPTFSEPARSTRFSLPVLVDSSLVFCSTEIIKQLAKGVRGVRKGRIRETCDSLNWLYSCWY